MVISVSAIFEVGTGTHLPQVLPGKRGKCLTVIAQGTACLLFTIHATVNSSITNLVLFPLDDFVFACLSDIFLE